MADKAIANSTIRKTELTDKAAPKPVERQKKTNVVQEGQTVNRSDFSDEEWAHLVETGAVVESVSERLETPSTKTADMQAQAADASPSNAPDQVLESDDGSYTTDQLNERANTSAKVEAEVSRQVELDEETRLAIANLPAQEQRNALETAKRAAIEEALQQEGLTEAPEEKKEENSSGGSGGSE